MTMLTKKSSIKSIVIPECFNRGSKKWIPAFAGMTKAVLIFILMFSLTSPAHASEWNKKEGYWAKTGGKFLFGLKYVIFSFAAPWFESNEPTYKREWEGFCTGLGKFVVYEAAGIIHLVTFPIPVDVPDVGIGMHIPNKFCPLRHERDWKGEPPAAAEPALEPVVYEASDSEENLKEELEGLSEETLSEK